MLLLSEYPRTTIYTFECHGQQLLQCCHRDHRKCGYLPFQCRPASLSLTHRLAQWRHFSAYMACCWPIQPSSCPRPALLPDTWWTCLGVLSTSGSCSVYRHSTVYREEQVLLRKAFGSGITLSSKCATGIESPIVTLSYPRKGFVRCSLVSQPHSRYWFARFIYDAPNWRMQPNRKLTWQTSIRDTTKISVKKGLRRCIP